MIKNLLLIALRHFKKDKWFSLLNVLGLTIGITFSLFLIFYITDELSYDRFNTGGGSRLPDATTPPAAAPAIQKEIPGLNLTMLTY